jgi:hypothetical protein
MFDNYPDVVTVENLMEMLHIGKSSAYSLLKQNAILHIRIGSKYIIPKKAVIGFLDGSCYNEKQIINGGLNCSQEGGV